MEEYILNQNKLICRMVGSERDAVKLFTKIKEPHNNDLKYKFIGKFKPDIHGDNVERMAMSRIEQFNTKMMSLRDVL